MPESVEVNAIRARAGQWAACALTILVAAGRSAPESVLAHSPIPITPSVSQSTDTARVGCYGGYAALSSGNLLTRDGTLVRYEKPFRATETYTFIRRDSVAAARVFAELERIRFRTLRFTEIDNMTCSLELKDRVGQHSVSWKMGRPPAELEPVLAALNRAFGDDRPRWP